MSENLDLVDPCPCAEFLRLDKFSTPRRLVDVWSTVLLFESLLALCPNCSYTGCTFHRGRYDHWSNSASSEARPPPTLLLVVTSRQHAIAVVAFLHVSALHDVGLLAPGDGEEDGDEAGEGEDEGEGEGRVDALEAAVDIVRAQGDAGDDSEHAEGRGDPDGAVARGTALVGATVGEDQGDVEDYAGGEEEPALLRRRCVLA